MRQILFCIDGFTFRRINDYCRDEHPRRARLQPAGMRQWVRMKVAEIMGWKASTRDLGLECHFYHPFEDPRERLGLASNAAGGLRFEELLQEAGFTMHYAAPECVRRLRPNLDLGEDVLLSAVYGKIDAVALFTTQGQYAPLLSRLRDLGMPTVLIGWEGLCLARSGERIPWRTDGRLRDACHSYVAFESCIGLQETSMDPFVEQLFVKPRPRRQIAMAFAS
jgi:hypothetical protein